MCLIHGFWPSLVDGLANGFLYALIALGYTLVYGVLRLINFAHSEVFMSGGFAGLFLLDHLVGHRTPTGWQSVALIVAGSVAGGLAGAVVAYVLERVAYRPLRRRRAPKIAYLISAIGASYFLLSLAGKEFGRTAAMIPQPAHLNRRVFSLFGAPVSVYDLVIVTAALLMLVFLDRLVARTRLGQGIRAVAQDADTASLMGVDIDRVISRTFIIGGLLGGAAGFLYGLQLNVVYTMGFTPGLKAFTAAVLGGIGNVRGAMVGGLLLGVIESLSVSCIQPAWTDVIAFGILVSVLLVRPTGILGERLGRSA